MKTLVRRFFVAAILVMVLVSGIVLINGSFYFNSAGSEDGKLNESPGSTSLPASPDSTPYSQPLTGATSLSDTLTERLQSLGFQLVEPADPLDFTLPDPSGEEHSVTEQRGNVIVLNFWATWCPPCKEEMPSMQRLWERHQGEGLTVLALNMQESASSVQSFVEDFDLTFPVRIDRKGIADRMRVTTLPTTWLIGPDGKTIAKLVGPIAWDSSNVRTTLNQLMRETGAVDA